MSKHSNLDAALSELIELVGMNLHEYPETIEQDILEDVAETYEEDVTILREAYNKWLKEA